jgi:hypothetical protein
MYFAGVTRYSAVCDIQSIFIDVVGWRDQIARVNFVKFNLFLLMQFAGVTR